MDCLVGSVVGWTLFSVEVRMRTGDIKRIGKRTYCVMCWTEHEITLQSMDEERMIIVMPRKYVGGLRKGS
jgi:hypothetical protein